MAKRWRLLGFLALILTGLVIVCVLLFPRWYYLKSDELTRISIDTNRKLDAYEHSENAIEMRNWLIEHLRSDAITQQVCINLAHWSLQHQREFIVLIKGLQGEDRSLFVEVFPFIVCDSGQKEEFIKAFQGYSAPVLDDIKNRVSNIELVPWKEQI